MNAELRILFSDAERLHIAEAIQISSKTGTPISDSIRQELGLQSWQTEGLDRIFQHRKDNTGLPYICQHAGYTKDILVATDLLLESLQGRLNARLEMPETFVTDLGTLEEFLANNRKRMETIASVRHLLANALTAFSMLED